MKIQRIKFKDLEQAPHFQLASNFKQNFQGSSPAPFIGRFGYPKVNIGFLSPQISGDTSNYDAPRSWSKKQTPINSIASLRYGLVNSRTQKNVKDLENNSRFLQIIQEVGMASRPVELDVQLKKAPMLDIQPEKEVAPFGPASHLQQARITANTKVEAQVEKVVSDTDLKAAPGIISLYSKGFEENFLTKLI